MGCSYLEPFYQYHWCLPYPGHRKNGGGETNSGRKMDGNDEMVANQAVLDGCFWKDACCINACEACRSLMMVTSLIPSIQFRPGEALFYGRWLSISSTESYRIILMSIIFIFIHIIFVLVFPKVFWPCHRWLFFLMCSFFAGTAITLINDSFTSGPREWWVGKICLKNLQTTAAQELHELELHVIFCDLFRFWFLIFGFFFFGVISDWECYVTILPSPESTKSRNKCRTKHWRPNIESSAPCFDRAIVTMICGSSNDSLVVTWLMFGAWRGELGMTVWFLHGIWRFLYGFSHFLSSLIDEMSCEST